MIGTTGPVPDNSDIAPAARELDSRTSDGIHVQLLWYTHDNHLSVVVSDSKTGETFELGVHHDQRALDVFHHPYAYAAETRDPGRVAAQSASA